MQCIYSESYNFSFYNAKVKSLFKMFPPVPDVVEGSPERCRTCAVVGNSANLKRSHYRPLIDYHDIVIRMNHGRTKGYEADVGNRTTHHVMYPESAAPLDSTTHLVLFPFKIKDLQWLLQKCNQGPAFMKYVHVNWLHEKGRYPSTGFLTVALSMHICDEISVFGFGAGHDGNWGHYFEVLRDKNLRTGPHAGTHEYKVIEGLHKVTRGPGPPYMSCSNSQRVGVTHLKLKSVNGQNDCWRQRGVSAYPSLGHGVAAGGSMSIEYGGRGGRQAAKQPGGGSPRPQLEPMRRCSHDVMEMEDFANSGILHPTDQSSRLG
ncbi:hypothetical protein INR49_032385, partial [Caranx melampygus]